MTAAHLAGAAEGVQVALAAVAVRAAHALQRRSLGNCLARACHRACAPHKMCYSGKSAQDRSEENANLSVSVMEKLELEAGLVAPRVRIC